MHAHSLIFIFVLQSVSVPLQGFLNAIVYGWTREDFIQVIRPNPISTQSSRTESASLLHSKRPSSPLRYSNKHFIPKAPCDIQSSPHENRSMLFSVDSELEQ